MTEKKELPFLKIPRVFTKKNADYDLDVYEFRVLSIIYDYTIGFNRTKWKLTNVQIATDAGLSTSKIGEITKRTCKKAKIIRNKVKGGYEYEITIVPVRKGGVILKETNNYLEGNATYPKEKVSRGAIDSIIDTIKDKDSYEVFKSYYPQGKFYNPLEAWNALTEEEREDAVEGIKVQVKIWKDEGMNLKFIKSASNYLKEKMFNHYQIKDYIDSDKKEFITKHILNYKIWDYVSEQTSNAYYHKGMDFKEVLLEAFNNGYEYYYPLPEQSNMTNQEVMTMLNKSKIINKQKGVIQFKIE